jgi:quercetin dioxygenase-like cupin family protein
VQQDEGQTERALITVSMPPGVEHSLTCAIDAVAGHLITVSMPPGVEHWTALT